MVLLFLYDEVTEEHQKSQWAAHAYDSTNPNSAHFERCLIVRRVSTFQSSIESSSPDCILDIMCLFVSRQLSSNFKISTYEKINNNVHKVSVCFLKYIYHKQQPILKEAVWSTNLFKFLIWVFCCNYPLVKKKSGCLRFKI